MTRRIIVAAIAGIAVLTGCAMDSGERAQGPRRPTASNRVDHFMPVRRAVSPAVEANTVLVGGAAMYPSKTIIENAVNSRDHTTLVAAVRAAGLADTLSGMGPFTVFAPTNAAFNKLNAGAVNALMQPANRAALTRLLTYHVVAGRLTAADLAARIREGGGRAVLTTAAGAPLTITQPGNRIMVTDAHGDVSIVTTGDVMQSNGVIHVVDTVLMPPQA